jgi:hypothetical protein
LAKRRLTTRLTVDSTRAVEIQFGGIVDLLAGQGRRRSCRT